MMRLPVVLFCLILSGCTWNDRRAVIKPSGSITDSIDKAYTVTGKDGDTETGRSAAKILKDCLANYKVVTAVDTVMATDSGTLQIHLKHYCAYDSGIILPQKYAGVVGLNSFAVNNFITDVLLSRNFKPVYAGRITRDDFLHLADEPLKSYGVLMGMGRKLQLSRSRLGFVVNYNFGIPLTDIGRPVSIAIEPNGTRQVFTDYGIKAEKTYPDSAKLKK